jgi:C-terminal processing protease CtpA/Prc
MNTWKKTLVFAAAALICAPAMAQEPEGDLDVRRQEAERRLAAEEAEAARHAEEDAAEMARLSEQMKADALELSRRHASESEEYEVRMREAERRMAEAARQMADLSTRQWPQVERFEQVIRANRGPVLGVTVGGDGKGDPVAGVNILGVTPGGAAEEAGLRSGDVITSINGESLTADDSDSATDKLLDFMSGVEDGDELKVEYLRDGKSESVLLTPRPIEHFVFDFDGGDFVAPDVEVHVDPHSRGGLTNKYVWISHDGGFGEMEMVKLTERLGKYFGTDEGLLVVRAPTNKDLRLEDGDVILNIDGREPNSVSHAMRILGSYQAGEALEVEIMRDKKKRKIEIEMPDNRRSFRGPGVAPGAPGAPRPVIAGGAERT